MKYVGRFEARISKDVDGVEIWSLSVNQRKGYRGDTLIEECGDADFINWVSDLLGDRSGGVYDIAGRYHEEYHQDYWGEWDGNWCIDGERFRYLGSPR